MQRLSNCVVLFPRILHSKHPKVSFNSLNEMPFFQIAFEKNSQLRRKSVSQLHPQVILSYTTVSEIKIRVSEGMCRFYFLMSTIILLYNVVSTSLDHTYPSSDNVTQLCLNKLHNDLQILSHCVVLFPRILHSYQPKVSLNEPSFFQILFEKNSQLRRKSASLDNTVAMITENTSV